MQIKLQSTVLADLDLAAGIAGPFGMVLNGTQLYDAADFFRATEPTFFLRGNVTTSLQFQCTRFFPTLAKAEAFALLHWGAIPRSGVVTVTGGDASATQVVYLDNAILESASVVRRVGVAVTVQYTILGGIWSGDVPPDIPGSADSAEGFIVMRRGAVAIAARSSGAGVAFSAPLATVPIVTVTVSRPAGGDAIWAIVQKGSVTVNGFSYELSGAPPDGTYELNYIAVE